MDKCACEVVGVKTLCLKIAESPLPAAAPTVVASKDTVLASKDNEPEAVFSLTRLHSPSSAKREVEKRRCGQTKLSSSAKLNKATWRIEMHPLVGGRTAMVKDKAQDFASPSRPPPRLLEPGK